MDTASELHAECYPQITRPPGDMSSKHYSINGHSIKSKCQANIPHSTTGFKHILLTIQLDALSALVDEQATRRLWKLFTNCAGSIAHGRRLENLSWRSWGRDQSLMHQTRELQQQPKVRNSNREGMAKYEWQTAPLNDNGVQLGLEYRPLDNPACSTPEKQRQCTTTTTTTGGGSGESGMRTPRISSSPPTTRSLGSRDSNDDDHREEGSSTRCRSILQGQASRLDGSSSTSVPSLSHSSSTSTSTLMSTTTIATSTSAKLSFPRFESSTEPALSHRHASTEIKASASSSSSLLSPPPPPSNSFAVSRSPPLGPLIKRVIFTPPCPTDHAAAALEELMTSVEGRLCAMEQRTQDRGSGYPASHSRSEEGQRHPTPHLSSPSQAATFPTVVILESTPKPTPPDTPARGLSPSSDAQRSIFHFQTLSPLHALINPNQVTSPDSDQSGLLLPTTTTTSLNSQAVLEPSPAPRLTPMMPTSESSSSTSSPNVPATTAVVENIKAPVPSAPGINRGQIHHEPHSLDSRTSSPEHLASLLNPPTATTVSRHVHSNSEGGAVVVGGMAPTNTNISHRMFFLQRDSSSLSPDSNSRSGSHSRSPASRSPDVHIIHGPLNQTVPGVAGREDGGAVSQTQRDALEAETKMEKIASESKQNPNRDDTTAISRELLQESSACLRPSPPPAHEQPSMSVPNASSSSSSHTHHPSRQQRLVMRSKKGGYRPHLGRAHYERPSSRTSARASVGSRGSGSTSTTAGGRGGAGAGSVDANAGSTSASGMGSMSTSAGSKLIMKRHPRTHSPLRNSVPVSDPAAATLPPSTQRREQLRVASGSGQQQQSDKKEPHVSPLAVLPEPLRMEALERQVMQTAMKSQSAGRKISLESDSEDDYTDDDEVEVDETDDDDDIVVVKGAQKDTGKVTQRAVVEEEEGSSWSDEDEGEVILAKKRPQAQQQKQSGPIQPSSRRNSKDLDHLVGSAGSERQSHEHAKPQAHLPHVKSKGKIAHNHHHAHVQRQQLSPPLRPAVARKASAGHTRSAPSQDGPLAQAAREALRQRDMFTPLPRETYSSTNLVREKSRTSLSRGGRPSNLTMLLNPDPQWFPHNHPYRQDVHPMDQKLSRSMEEVYARGNGNRSPGGSGSGVKSPRPGIGLGFGGLKMTTTAQPTPRTQVPTPVPAPAPAPVNKSASPDAPPPSKRLSSLDKSPPPPAQLTKLRLSKSAIAIPAVTGVTASSTPRDEKQADILEMSLRQMGPAQRRPRVTRHAQEPARPELERRISDQQRDQRESSGTPSSRPTNRLGAKPADIEFSDTEDEAPSSPPPKVAGTSSRSLAKEHLEAVMGGKVKTGMSASRTVVASPDALPKESRESDPTSYRPPAPPSSPSVYNAHEAKRPQGHLPHTPPSSKRPPVARAPRNRPHSSHGQPTAPVVSPTPPTTVAPQRERRQPATSQPPIPVTTAPVHSVAPYPYNLPYPAPLQSPRTTRLNMLASEVPDDLRKDLLWERKTNRIAPMLDNRAPTPLAPLRRNADAVVGGLRPMTNITAGGGGTEGDEASEQARLEREAQERYDRMRTQTWNGVIYQRPVW